MNDMFDRDSVPMRKYDYFGRMMRDVLFSLAVWCGIPFGMMAQTAVNVPDGTVTAREWLMLTGRNSTIATDDTLNERMVDLVQVAVADSVIRKKKQHHRVFVVGWLIHAFGGYNWRALSTTKRKFVGTVHRNSRSSDEHFTEYDINYDIYFLLPHYQRLNFAAYDRQRELKRQDYRRSHRRDYNVEPFVRDTLNFDRMKYRLHCELTPPRAYRAALDAGFYPTLPGQSLGEHWSIGTDKPTIGVYGLWCLDCNHSCHPELHPYEWIWWLRANEGDTTATKTWMLGLFHESSNRMPDWSTAPVQGRISIPFAISADDVRKGESNVLIEHLVHSGFGPTMPQWTTQGSTPISAKTGGEVIRLSTSKGEVRLRVRLNHPIRSDAYALSVSDLVLDTGTGTLCGRLNLSVSATELYTTRVTFSAAD